MKPHNLLLAALTIATACTAHAQTGLYATIGTDRYTVSNVTLADNTKSGWPYGPTFGLYDDSLKVGPVHFGVDLRGEIMRGGGYSRNSFLPGLRASLSAPAFPLRPYIQASAGIASTNFNVGGSSSSTNIEYRIIGGVDYTLLPHLDWRMFEVGGGSLLSYNLAPASGLGQSNSIFTISSGLVLRLR